jgi:hypothetical protein
MALGSRRGNVVCKGQLSRGVSEELRVAMEAKELMGGRVVLVIGAGLFGAPDWRVERRGEPAETRPGAEVFAGAAVGEMVGAVDGAGREEVSERES